MKLLNFDNYNSWGIKETDYPKTRNIEEQIKFILGYAILAPSAFNAQPWKCRINNNVLKIYLDNERLTVRSDKTGRFANLSIGAFIENLRIACEYFGWNNSFKLEFKKHLDKRLIAIVKFNRGKNSNEETHLFRYITKRSTNRSLSKKKNIPDEVIEALRNFSKKDMDVVILNQEFRKDMVEISLIGDKNIWTDFEFRKEHIAWIRTNITKKYDGMPGFGVGISLIPSLFATPVVLSPIFPKFQAIKNKKGLISSLYYVILCSKDSDSEWVKLGQLYEKMILYLTSKNIAAAPMGQFIEDDEARKELKNLIKTMTSLEPQFFFRIGYPTKPVRHSPRIPVEKIIF